MQNVLSMCPFIDIYLSLPILEPAQPPIRLVTAAVFNFWSRVDAAWRSSLFSTEVNARK